MLGNAKGLNLGLDVESSVSPEHFIEHCVSLWHIADFLLLGPLKSTAEKAVHKYCDERMKTLATLGPGNKWRDVEDGRKLSPWALDMISGIRESYRWKIKPLKAVLMEFLWVGRPWTLSRTAAPALMDHLKDTANFMGHFLSRYASRPWIGTAVWAPAPRTDMGVAHARSVCRRCGEKMSWAKDLNPVGQIFDPFELNRFSEITSGWCLKCSKLDGIPWRS